MSLSIGQYGASGINQILNSGIQDIQNQQQINSWQATQGTVSDSIAGLGNNRRAALATSPKIAEISDYQSNINSVQKRLSMSADTMKQITSLAQDLSTQVLSLSSTSGSSPVPLDATTKNARSAMDTLGNILNTSDGMGYIFSGSSENEPTIPSPNHLADSPLATSIAKTVSGLSDNNAADILKSATSAAADNSPSMSVFSSSLSTSATDAKAHRRAVVIGADAATTTNGIVATEGEKASDTSTGSPIRDLMRDLMVVSSLKGMDSSKPGFQSLVKQLHTSLTSTSNHLINMSSSIGVQQNSLTRQQASLTSVQTMFKQQMSANIDVDLASVATQTSDLSTRLKASFSLIAKTKNMTLADYM